MRVAVVGVLAESLVRFRGELLRAMAAAGHEVLGLAPEEDAGVRSALREIGVDYQSYPLERAGMNPLRDLATVWALAGIFRSFRADLVLSYAAKPVIYGTQAARLAGVPRRAAMITGIGSVLQGGGGPRGRVLAGLLRGLYAGALRQADLVVFQNPDDEQLFRTLKLVGPRNRVARVNGSGVDLALFAPSPLPSPPVTFLLVGRLIRDKGIIDYVDAARRVRAVRPDARFQLLGPLDSNPTAIPAAEVESWRAEGAVDYLGSTHDVRPFLSAAHVCVLPSYGEGTPRSVLEAMAMGRAVLVTDVPGCRETVEPGVNGLMVPPRDPEALARAMIELLEDPAALPGMGRRSRELAEERFDVHAVNRVLMDALGLG